MQIPDRFDPLAQSQTPKVKPDRQAVGALDEQIEKLKQLISKLRQTLTSLPAELRQLVGSLIAQGELALASGDPIAIGQLIIKLEEALAMIQAVLQAIAAGDLQAAQDLMAAFISKMTGLKKARDKMLKQQEVSMEASLEAMLRNKFNV